MIDKFAIRKINSFLSNYRKRLNKFLFQFRKLTCPFAKEILSFF